MVVAEYAFAAVWGTYLLAWALAVVVLVVLAIMLFVSRGPSDTVRDAFRRVVATGAKAGSLHAVSQGGSPARVAAAIRDLRAVDPGFDATVFLDGSRMAVGAYAMAVAAMDDRLLRRIATPGYWQTTNGKALAARIAEWRRYASGRPGTANQGRVLLEASWREPEVRDVVLGEQGIDRITVRLGSVMVGAIRASWQRLEGAEPGWQRLDGATQLDWDFVRPTGQRTDPEAVLLPRTCANCGGPYRSDLDDACPHCRATRPDAQAGWRLDCTYLVVDT